MQNEILFRDNPALKPDPTVPLKLVNNILRIINIALTVPLCGLLIYRQYLQFQYDKMKKYLKFQDLFRKSKHLQYALAECLLHLVLSLPYVEWNVCYHASGRQVCNPISDYFMFFAVLRCYLVTRVYFHLCSWTSPGNEKICD